MSALTTRYGLYKPGGGSTGLVLPDEILDIDKLNQDLDKIDAALGIPVVTSVTLPGAPVDGQAVIESDTGNVKVFDDGPDVWITAGFGSAAIDTPVGTCEMWLGAAAPNSKWLLCDGAAVSRGTYAALFALIGVTHGAGDGSTTFNLPDFRGRGPVGVGTGTDVFTFAAAAVTVATDIITLTSTRSLPTGTPVVLTNSGGSVPTGLVAVTTYYVIQVTPTTYQLAANAANAKAGVQIDITAQGSGTNTLTKTFGAVTLAQKFGAEAHTHNSTNLLAQFFSAIGRFVNGRSWTATNTQTATVGGASATASGTGLGVQGNTDEEYNAPPSLGINFIVRALA